MPRVKPSKRKTTPYSCSYEGIFYEIYDGSVLMSKHQTKKAAENESRQLKKSRPFNGGHVTIRKSGICTYGEICKYRKNCHEAKGITFSQPWGQKMLMLLKMKREPPLKPKKDKELNRFF